MGVLTCPACLERLPLASGRHTYDNPGCGYLSPAALKDREERFSLVQEDWENEQRIDEGRIGERKTWRRA